MNVWLWWIYVCFGIGMAWAIMDVSKEDKPEVPILLILVVSAIAGIFWPAALMYLVLTRLRTDQ